MMEQGSVRNLEQIQEHDDESRTPRGVTILLVALGGACVVFAGLALGGRRSTAAMPKTDPLGELVVQQTKPGSLSALAAANAARPMDLAAKDVTFPGILSDESAPTTALAAVKAPPGTNRKGARAAEAASDVPATDETPAGPPPPSDRLPVVPLPAQHVLEATPVVTRPRDPLTRAATDAAQIATAAEPAAPAGREGGYQLQVSSFRSQTEADQFAAQLRARGHKAYVAEARVPGRGTWYRVRIGPFPSQQAAAAYRTGFEGREHVVPFIVPPKPSAPREP